jgi:hypothetical protein
VFFPGPNLPVSEGDDDVLVQHLAPRRRLSRRNGHSSRSTWRRSFLVLVSHAENLSRWSSFIDNWSFLNTFQVHLYPILKLISVEKNLRLKVEFLWGDLNTFKSWLFIHRRKFNWLKFKLTSKNLRFWVVESVSSVQLIYFRSLNLGILTSLRIGFYNASSNSNWLVEHILIQNEFTGKIFLKLQPLKLGSKNCFEHTFIQYIWSRQPAAEWRKSRLTVHLFVCFSSHQVIRYPAVLGPIIGTLQ